MCSVTFWPRRGGYLLAMNRDERRTRVAGLPPECFPVGARTVAHPREPAGGTWISVHDRGAAFTLVNWYAITACAPQPVASRGEVVLALRGSESVAEADARLAGLPLSRLNPFRVMGFFPSEHAVCEWRWNLHELEYLRHGWATRQWLSSGHDESVAQRVRVATFAARRGEGDAGSLAWLRRLHASHGPKRGPFSICMHRADAATVSYTEVEVTAASVGIRYCSGSPCCARGFAELALPRQEDRAIEVMHDGASRA